MLLYCINTAEPTPKTLPRKFNFLLKASCNESSKNHKTKGPNRIHRKKMQNHAHLS